MNVIKIVVDEVPESCRDCCFSRFRAIRIDIPFLWWCVAVNDNYIQGKERPIWCPLVIEIESE